jgi:AraC-like DNA-binding protein
VHKLLEETGKTFSEHVLEERLTLAFAMLTEPSMARRKITDVAAATGFSDISYFNRTFRRRFGDTPSAVRARWRI